MAIVKSETQSLGNYQHSSVLVSLYVGDLSPDVTEDDLISRFSLTIPPSIFAVTPSPENPCATLTSTSIHLSPHLLGEKRMFSPFGDILSCKVAEENDHSKGFRFVQFDTEQSVVAARCALNGSLVDSKKLFVAKFVNKNERAAMSGNQEFTNVYVKNLSVYVTEDVLHRLFSQYGTFSSVVVMRDGMGRSRGFGFVNFCLPENAKKTVESLNGYQQLGSKSFFVGRALRKAERTEMLKGKHRDNFIAKFNMGWSNMFVKNLSESVDETRLRKIIGSSYGYLQPFHVGPSYYYNMGTQLPQMLGYQNMNKASLLHLDHAHTLPFVAQVPAAGKAHLNKKKSFQLVYKRPVYMLFLFYIPAESVFILLIWRREDNKKIEAATTCSKAMTKSGEKLEKMSSGLRAIVLSPNRKAQEI
ncbi:unnamed protein product [Cochlearia groenlandica]